MLILIYIIVLFTSYDDDSWDAQCENANSRNSLFEIKKDIFVKLRWLV